MTAMTDPVAGPAPRSLPEVFAYRRRHHPDADLVLTPAGAGLTYGQAGALADAWADRLRALGVRDGDRVGVHAGNEPAWLVASLAVWAVGATVVACGTILSPQEAVAILRRAGVAAVLSTRPDALAELPDVPRLAVDPLGASGTAAAGGGSTDGEASGGTPAASASVTPVSVASSSVAPEAEALVVFTSGTTGTPRAVVYRHDQLVTSVRQIASAYTTDLAFRTTAAPPGVAPGVVFTPYGHLGCYFSVGFRMWIGRPVVLVAKFNLTDLRRLLERYRFSALQLAPAMIHTLAFTDEPVPLSGLRYVTSGTAPLPEATAAAFERRYGVPVLQAYGMTEVGTISQERYEDVVAGRRPKGSVGRPATGVRVRIVDPSGRDLPPGEVGEIVVSTPTMGDDPRGDGDASAGDGWIATGDLGCLDEDGFLYVKGRLKDTIIAGGLNIHPTEVEATARDSRLVADVVVVGVPDPRLGEIPVAGVVWAAHGDPADLARQLESDLRQRLAHYKVPRRFFTLDRVPLTGRGKVDRRRAQAIAVEALGVASGSTSPRPAGRVDTGPEAGTDTRPEAGMGGGPEGAGATPDESYVDRGSEGDASPAGGDGGA